METERGSAEGISDGIIYETSEIKYCGICEHRIKESYRCEKLLPIKVAEKSADINL